MIVMDWLKSLIRVKPSAFRASIPAADGPLIDACQQVEPSKAGIDRPLVDAPVPQLSPDDVTAMLQAWAERSQQGVQQFAGRTDRIEARYDAAQTTFALREHWKMSDMLSADAANSFAVRKVMRERSRYEFANNSYLCGIGRTLANDVIGRGPRLQMLIANERIGKRVETLWKAWAKEIKLAKKLRIARESQARDGEVFLLFVTNKSLRSPIKLDVQVLECDQVEDYFFIPTPEQPVSGMELDDAGNPAFYHVLKMHPGSAVVWAENPYEYDRVEAQFVVHMFKADRPSQHRGVPECASSLSLFAILRAYTMATLDAARLAGTLNYCIGTTSNLVPPALIKGVPAFTPLHIPPGTIPLLPDGYTPMQMDMQKPVCGFGEFSDQIINEAARPVSMPRNIATGNSSDYNFSSAKMDKATYYNAVGIDQHDIGEEVMDHILIAFLAECEDLGELDTLDDESPLGPYEEWDHEWEWDSPDPIDEEKTANADQTNLTTGKLTLGPSDIIRMTQTAKALGLTLQQYQQLIVMNAFAAGMALPPGTTVPNGVPLASVPGASPQGNPPAGGEYSGMSRLQWSRNRKAIQDILDQFANGKMGEKSALVFLQTLGLSPESAESLLEDADGTSAAPAPTGGNSAVTV